MKKIKLIFLLLLYFCIAKSQVNININVCDTGACTIVNDYDDDDFWVSKQNKITLDADFWNNGGVDTLVSETNTIIVAGSMSVVYSGSAYTEDSPDSVLFETILNDQETVFGQFNKDILTENINGEKAGTAVLRTINSDFPGTKIWIKNKPGTFSEGNRVVDIYYETKTYK